MIEFIDDHRASYGVEPICRVLPIAPSTYYEHKAREAQPEREPSRIQRDRWLSAEIQRIWDENFGVYGIRKVWPQLHREAIPAARCTVERLMRRMGLRGVVRGKPIRTTIPDLSKASPSDLVRRQFQPAQPNALWASDFTHVATWQGVVYVAFVIDAFARRIIGWRVSRSPRTETVMDALEQVLYERSQQLGSGLIHHSDRGVQYVSIRYTERLEDVGIAPSVGSVGDSYDNALAETVIGLFKTEVIRRRGPWRHLEAVEFATLEWVDWFNHRRLLESIGNMPPVEREELYYEQLGQEKKAA